MSSVHLIKIYASLQSTQLSWCDMTQDHLHPHSAHIVITILAVNHGAHGRIRITFLIAHRAFPGVGQGSPRVKLGQMGSPKGLLHPLITSFAQ